METESEVGFWRLKARLVFVELKARLVFVELKARLFLKMKARCGF